MSNYKDIPYNKVCFKASHNSYEKNISLSMQIQKGCMGLELDISQSSDGKNWSVDHSNKYFTDNDKQLTKYLQELQDWSANNSGHDVITVFLDLKKIASISQLIDFPTRIDSYIQNNFPEDKIFLPRDLMKNKWGLAYAAKENGWPLLKDLENKFIFCLTGDDVKNLKIDLKQKNKRYYVNTKLKERICFADNRKRKTQKPDPGQRIFFNYNFRKSSSRRISIEQEKWAEMLKPYANRRDVITRGFNINNRKSWKQALESGFNILATDEIDESWTILVGNQPFERTVSDSNS